MAKVMEIVPQMIFNPDIRSGMESVYTECLEIGLQGGDLADPAFSFAYSETKFFPT
jgi:hypothetical protein